MKPAPGSAAKTSPFSAAEGRRFAFTLAIAFAVLSGFLFWRDKETPSLVSGGLALVLLLAGLLIPSKLRPVERAWMAFALALSRVMTPIFMGIVYFVVLTPIGLLRRALGHDSLARKRDAATYWVVRENSPDAGTRRRRMERQF